MMGDAAAGRVARRWKTAALAPNDDDLTSAGKRTIPKNHEFQARALKPLSKALWASTVALGHTLTAYRHLSRLKSTTVSPDGLMGGRGYVMKLADMRQKLYEASEALSAISDTMFDEINGPHWKPKLAQLDESDREDVARFVEEAQEVMENPEGEAEEEIEEIEAKSKSKAKTREGEGDKASGLPLADAAQDESAVHSTGAIPAGLTKEASSARRGALHDIFAPEPPVVAREVRAAIYGAPKRGNSSQPVSDMPGGPRVDHLGPGTGTGNFGDFNPPESPPADQWNADGGGISRRDDSGEDYDFPSEWENDLSRSAALWKAPEASASIPDSSSDDTPTDAWDFGIGYGARGEGAGGHENPSGEGNGTKGVHGPQSGLPGVPSQSSGDSAAALDGALNRRAYEALYGLLPQDVSGDVARSDYYTGAKDNSVTVAESSVPQPNTVLLGESQTPTPQDTRSESGQRLLNTYYTLDDVNTPYQRYDFTTHTLREPDGLSEGQDYQEPFAPGGEATR
jgi:hypothetical protein